MQTEIISELAVDDICKLRITWNGYEYRTIIGHNSSGYFVAIPIWNVATVISEPCDTYYNAHKLGEALKNEDAGKAIAEAIKDWRERKKL